MRPGVLSQSPRRGRSLRYPEAESAIEFDHERRARVARRTPGEQPATTAAVVQRPNQLDQSARARWGLRVPVDQAAAEGVHGVDVSAHLAGEPEVVDGERIVRLDDGDVGELEPGMLERDAGRGDWGLGHLAARNSREAAGHEPG